MAIWLGPRSRNPGQSTPPALRRQARLVATSTWSPLPPARQPRARRMVRCRKVRGAPAGPVCPVVSGTRPVVVGIAPVVGTAVVPDRAVVGAAAAVVGGGPALVEESTSAGPDPPQPVTAAASSSASIAVTLEGRAGNRAPRALSWLSAAAAIVAAMMQLDAPERDASRDPA